MLKRCHDAIARFVWSILWLWTAVKKKTPKQIHHFKGSQSWSFNTGSGPTGPKALRISVAMMFFLPKYYFFFVFLTNLPSRFVSRCGKLIFCKFKYCKRVIYWCPSVNVGKRLFYCRGGSDYVPPSLPFISRAICHRKKGVKKSTE